MTRPAPALDQPSTWYQMLGAMRDRCLNTDERLGQAHFNALYNAWPDVAELVRGTDADPFYADSFKDPRMDAFFDAIEPYFK